MLWISVFAKDYRKMRKPLPLPSNVRGHLNDFSCIQLPPVCRVCSHRTDIWFEELWRDWTVEHKVAGLGGLLLLGSNFLFNRRKLHLVPDCIITHPSWITWLSHTECCSFSAVIVQVLCYLLYTMRCTTCGPTGQVVYFFPYEYHYLHVKIQPPAP